MNNLHSWLISLNTNEVQISLGLIGVLATLTAAFVAVKTAFGQIARQFEHKIMYEGWQDLQQKLFAFSNALTDFDSTVQWLTYFVSSQDNPLVNDGNKHQYRQNKWKELTGSFSNLQRAYIAFLRSFENHEIIFLPLAKMKGDFIKEYRERIDGYYQKFMEQLFPEMYGLSKNLTQEEANKIIRDYWLKMSEMSAFLDDFRIELQNITVGNILHKKVPRRKPSIGRKILTRKGFVIQKLSIKQSLEKRLRKTK